MTETSLARGFAAQDYRASLSRAERRIGAGETVDRCQECRTEIDVAAPSHGPSCSHRPLPAAKVKPEKGELSNIGKRQVTTATHSADGSLTLSEIARREEEIRDGSAVVTRCGLEGCDWEYTGSAGEGRAVFVKHRSQYHPGHVSPRHDAAAARDAARAAEAEQASALAAMDAGAPQPRPARDDYHVQAPDSTWGCKIPGCPGRSTCNRGPYAYLCEDHRAEQAPRLSAAINEGLEAAGHARAPELEPEPEPEIAETVRVRTRPELGPDPLGVRGGKGPAVVVTVADLDPDEVAAAGKVMAAVAHLPPSSLERVRRFLAGLL